MSKPIFQAATGHAYRPSGLTDHLTIAILLIAVPSLGGDKLQLISTTSKATDEAAARIFDIGMIV